MERMFRRLDPLTRVTSSTPAASALSTPTLTSCAPGRFLLAIGTRMYFGHTSALPSPLPMASVIFSFSPMTMSMSPPTSFSLKLMSGLSTKAILSMWKHGRLLSKSARHRRSGPMSWSSFSRTISGSPSTDALSTTVGSPHHRMSKSRMTSFVSRARPTLRTLSSDMASFPSPNSLKDRFSPMGDMRASFLPTAVPIFSLSAADSCGHSSASSPLSHEVVSWSGLLHHCGRSPTMAASPPTSTSVSACLWSSRSGVSVRRAARRFLAALARSVFLPSRYPIAKNVTRRSHPSAA